MKSRLIKTLGCALALLLAVPSLALTSGASTSSRQACAGASTSSAASSNTAIAPITCSVATINEWSTGYQIEITVTNKGSVPISSWEVRLAVPQSHTVASLWNATKTEISSTLLLLGNLNWNGTLAPNQSVKIGATFNKPEGSGGYPSCSGNLLPPNINTAPQGNFTAQTINDTVHVQTIDALDAEGDSLIYRFDFGDGTIINSNDVWHSYKSPGSYTITQTISDGKLTKTNTNLVTVTAEGSNRAPAAIFSYSISGFTVTVDAKASADRDGSPLVFAWDFGQGLLPMTTQNRTSAQVTNGFVTLTVFDGQLGNTVQYRTSGSTCINADALPQLSFTHQVNNNKLTLDASKSTNADSFSWDFGDGTTGKGMFASHTYAAPGTYTVTLNATGQMTSASKTQQVVIADSTPVNLPPVAELTCTELVAIGDDFENGIAYYTYITRCDASASLDPEGQPLSFTMNWGDGKTTTSTDGIFIYKYLTGGEYNLTLSVSDGVNAVQKSLPWRASNSTVNNRPPVACFDIAAGNTLNVNASCSTDPDNNPLTYVWDFGDGSSATGVNAIHNYSAAGSYVVKLTVSDGTTTSTLSKIFVVTQKPTRCEFQITNSWSGGFTGWFRVYNQSTNPISGWAGVIKFAEGTKVTSHWNGTVVGTNPYQVTPVAWNATLQPGTFAQVGFMVWDGATTRPTPQVSGPSCE